MSEVEVTETETLVLISARGGSRRERGSAIGAVVRGRNLTLVTKRRSETYGFLHATYATYRKV